MIRVTFAFTCMTYICAKFAEKLIEFMLVKKACSLHCSQSKCELLCVIKLHLFLMYVMYMVFPFTITVQVNHLSLVLCCLTGQIN